MYHEPPDEPDTQRHALTHRWLEENLRFDKDKSEDPLRAYCGVLHLAIETPAGHPHDPVKGMLDSSPKHDVSKRLLEEMETGVLSCATKAAMFLQ